MLFLSYKNYECFFLLNIISVFPHNLILLSDQKLTHDHPTYNWHSHIIVKAVISGFPWFKVGDLSLCTRGHGIDY